MQGMVGTVIVHEEGQAADAEGEAGSEHAFGEPEEVTIDEISRHPSDMPADTEWAR